MGLYVKGQDEFSASLTGMRELGNIEKGLTYVCA